MRHGGVVEGDDALGKNADDGHVNSGGLQFGFNGLFEDVADFALGCGVADVERKSGNLAGSGFGAKKGSADLGTVSMGKDDAVAVSDQANDLAGGAASIRHLFRDGAFFPRTDEGVATDGQEHGLHKTQPTASLHVRQLAEFCKVWKFHEFAFHQFEHDGLLRMQSIFGLLEDE